MQQARNRFGRGFDNRRLRVQLYDATTENQISARELYGDIGRWFIQLNQPGIWLRAELVFSTDNSQFTLNSAGPVFMPRDTPVEAEGWEELYVTYSLNEKRELRLEGVNRESSPAWPRISLDLEHAARPRRSRAPAPLRCGNARTPA